MPSGRSVIFTLRTDVCRLEQDVGGDVGGDGKLAY